MLKCVASAEEKDTILDSFVLCNLAPRDHCLCPLKSGRFKVQNVIFKGGDSAGTLYFEILSLCKWQCVFYVVKMKLL